MDVPFRKIEMKQCPVSAIKDFSDKYLGAGGFAQAIRDCAADDTCKAIVDVSAAFDYYQPSAEPTRGFQFLLCTSDERVDGSRSDVDIYVKGDFWSLLCFHFSQVSLELFLVVKWLRETTSADCNPHDQMLQKLDHRSLRQYLQ